MSVATHSPYHGTKRLFESSDSPERRCGSPTNLHSQYSHKKRFGSPVHRNPPVVDRQAYAVGGPVLQALRGLFPEMDEKAVAEALSACDNDVDAAIKRLKGLRLTAHCQGGAADPLTQSQPESQAGTPSTSQAEAQFATWSIDDWVEGLLQQMQESPSLEEARTRAANVLQDCFKQVSLRATQEKQAQLSELAKDNALLKRAVAIQNSRLQELVGKDAELAHAKQVIAQCQEKVHSLEEKVHSLELSNYSLAMHLRQATSSTSSLTGHRRPDVF